MPVPLGGPASPIEMRHSFCIRQPCRSAGALVPILLSELEPTWLAMPAVAAGLPCEALLSRSSGHEPGDVAASVRLRAASFRSIDLTCTLTVASAISRCRAICLLDSPRFTNVRTDASRGDRPLIRVSHWFDSIEGRGCLSRTPRPNVPLGTIVMSSAARAMRPIHLMLLNLAQKPTRPRQCILRRAPGPSDLR